jgi:hypothetical protein
MQSDTGGAQQVPAAQELDPVVGVAAVSGAASTAHQTGVAQFGEVIRDEVLWFAYEPGELAHAAVAQGELGQELPAQRVSDELKELWWRQA